MGIIESCVYHGAGWSVSQFAGIKEQRNHILLGERRVFLPIGKRIGLLFATGIGAGGGDGVAKGRNE